MAGYEWVQRQQQIRRGHGAHRVFCINGRIGTGFDASPEPFPVLARPIDPWSAVQQTSDADDNQARSGKAPLTTILQAWRAQRKPLRVDCVPVQSRSC